MSLELSNSRPNIEIKTWGAICKGEECIVHLGDYEIPFSDFMHAAFYVLTNTDLLPNDPRLNFLEHVKKLQVVEGYMTGRERLAIPDTLNAGA